MQRCPLESTAQGLKWYVNFVILTHPKILFDPSWESIWAEFGVDDVIRDVGPLALSLRRP